MSKLASGKRHSCVIRSDGSLWCWGDSSNNQLGYKTEADASDPIGFVPPDPKVPNQVGTATNWTGVSSVGTHTCGLQADGTLWCWGDNSSGQLGYTTVTINCPTNDPNAGLVDPRCPDNDPAPPTFFTPDTRFPNQVGTETTWTGVSLGELHSCGIQSNDTLWCWGDNFSGQLGNGTTTDNTSPVQIAGTTWLFVTAGSAHTCAIRTDGTLWCWGENLDGQLGLVPGTDQQLPLQVGTESDWTAVSAGGSHTCATKTDKSLSCWGDNLFGQLGDRFRIDRSSPFAIGTNPIPPPTPDTDWRSVSAGASHTCAIKESGALWCWGNNDKGRLGNGVKTDTLLPIQVEKNMDWVGVSSGEAHTCGTRSDGTVLCWGDNANGRLGLGTSATKTAPVRIGSESNWASLSAGNEAACATRTDGTLYCWGENGRGQLGDGSTDRRTTPTKIGADTNWKSVSVGDIHSCGLKTDNTIHCWGDNFSGQLGYDTSGITTVDPTKPNLVVSTSNWADIAAGSGFSEGRGHSCAVKTDGSLWCWGDNSSGQFGNGTGDGSDTPIQIGSVNTWASISAAGVHTCATRTDSSLWCWGINFTGQLGDGTMVDKSVPTVVDFFVIDSSNNALMFNDGANRTATLTAGTYLGNELATEIKLQLESENVGTDTYTVTYDSTAPKFTITNIASNANPIDFLFENAGTTAEDLLGFNATNHSPVAVGTSIISDNAEVVDTDWSAVGTRDLHTCAVKTDGTLWCWGNNFFGQIGDATTTNRLAPVQEVGAATDWSTVSIGGFHSCAVKTGGTLWCWGDNDEGQLGNGTTDDRTSPTRIGSDTDWKTVSSGTLFSCAVKTSGSLWCWGNNASGQLGDGAAWLESPTTVTFS